MYLYTQKGVSTYFCLFQNYFFFTYFYKFSMGFCCCKDIFWNETAKIWDMQNYLNLKTSAYMYMLNTYPANKMSSAKCLVFCNYQCAFKSLSVCENSVWVSNSLDPNKSPSYSACNPNASCKNIGLWLRPAW